MKVLLDTHVLLWALEGGERLSSRARELVDSEANEVLVSVVSVVRSATSIRSELDPLSNLDTDRYDMIDVDALYFDRTDTTMATAERWT